MKKRTRRGMRQSYGRHETRAQPWHQFSLGIQTFFHTWVWGWIHRGVQDLCWRKSKTNKLSISSDNRPISTFENSITHIHTPRHHSLLQWDSWHLRGSMMKNRFKAFYEQLARRCEPVWSHNTRCVQIDFEDGIHYWFLHCVLRTAPYRPRKVRGKFLGSRWMPLYAVMHQGKSRWLLSWFSGHKTTLNPEEWSTCTIPRNSSNWGGCTCSVPLWTVTLPPEESACLNLCASETIFSKELYPPRVETKWIKWSEEMQWKHVWKKQPLRFC